LINQEYEKIEDIEKEEINRNRAVKMSTIAVVHLLPRDICYSSIREYEKSEVPEAIWDELIKWSLNRTYACHIDNVSKELRMFIINNGYHTKQIHKPCDHIVMFCIET